MRVQPGRWYTGRREPLTPDATRLTVLLVEDDLDARRLYAEGLRRAGFHVEEAHNGRPVLERAFEVCPDPGVVDLLAADRRRLGEAQP